MNRSEQLFSDESAKPESDIVTGEKNVAGGIYSSVEIEKMVIAREKLMDDLQKLMPGPLGGEIVIAEKDIIPLSLLKKLVGTTDDPEGYAYKVALLSTQNYSKFDIAHLAGISESAVDAEWSHISEIASRAIPLSEDEILSI